MNAVVTVSIGDKYNRLALATHPTLEAYAKRVNADFVVINNMVERPHWEKFQIYRLLSKYKRIIYLDTDLIVREDCPNLFDLVPETQLGVFNEGRFESRYGSLKECCDAYRVPIPKKWDGTYYNTGVMVISRRHRKLFKLPEMVFDLGMFEQGYLNMKILTEFDNDHAKEKRVFELDYKLNRMQMLDKHCGIHRCDSYIVHYAGAPPQVDIMRIINEDLQNWKSHHPDYRYEREIVFYAGGGMGDQLGAEPVARFAMEHMFKDVKTNFTIITNWPVFFSHLNVPCMERTIYESNPRYDTPVMVLKTIPAPEESTLWQHWSHISGHTLDYAAISTIKRILPDENREIHLQPALEGLLEVMDISGQGDGSMILVHPGKGWASKTFPKEWWEAVINGLVANGKKVGVIGHRIDKEQGYVDVDIPEGVVDYRDILSLDGLIALIATSCMVISNDSAPVHIAGAFDNYILLIATCRHPDYILPYRKGSKTYKTFAFKKKLTIDEWDISPTQIFKESADVVKGSIYDYIPAAEEVVAKALEMVGPTKVGDKVESNQVLDFVEMSNSVGTGIGHIRKSNYEPEVQSFFRKVLKPGDNVIDVGASDGIFTQLAIELSGGGIVCAFEPEKTAFALLKSNINGASNVRLYNNAVGDHNGEVELYFNYDGDANSIWNPATHPFNAKTKNNNPIKEKVHMTTLDSMIDFAPRLIKTDTEGCELMVLKGAEQILRKYRPMVVCELNTFAMEQMGTNQKELNDFVKSVDYKAYSLPDEQELDLVSFKPLSANCNIVFKPIEENL